MVLDGILPNQNEVEESKVKMPDFVPKQAVFPVASLDDVDALPRGAIAHLLEWDEDIVLDLTVTAGIIIMSRPMHEEMAAHGDFDPDGFGILDDAGLWLPGLEYPYTAEAGGWRLPKEARVE